MCLGAGGKDLVYSRKNHNFTLEEAETLLPELEDRLRLLQNKKETYSRVHDALFVHELVCTAEESQGFFENNDGLEAGIHALEEAIEELAKDVESIFSLGCILRNIEKGEVEFLGSLEGQKIYFSWKIGEANIQHYRPFDSLANHRIKIPQH